MTGVSDLPFRRVVRQYGSGLNVTEMIASQAAIRETRQSIQKAMWDVKVKGINGDIAFIKQGPAGKESAQNVPSVYVVRIDNGKVVKN